MMIELNCVEIMQVKLALNRVTPEGGYGNFIRTLFFTRIKDSVDWVAVLKALVYLFPELLTDENISQLVERHKLNPVE